MKTTRQDFLKMGLYALAGAGLAPSWRHALADERTSLATKPATSESPFTVFPKVAPLETKPGDLTILSHNVFWFQGAPFATDQPPAARPEMLKRLCELYLKQSPDIVCLQELQDEAAAEMVSQELGMKYVYRAGGSYPQYGGGIFSRLPMESLPLEEGFVPDRILIPVKITLEGGGVLRLLNVHLPSSRQRGAAKAQERRLYELETILDQVDLLMGDFNEQPNGKSPAFLKEKGFIDVADTCSAGEEPSVISTRRIDQIWLSQGKADSLQSYLIARKETLAIEDEGKNFLSDHLPVGCILRWPQEG